MNQFFLPLFLKAGGVKKKGSLWIFFSVIDDAEVKAQGLVVA